MFISPRYPMRQYLLYSSSFSCIPCLLNKIWWNTLQKPCERKPFAKDNPAYAGCTVSFAWSWCCWSSYCTLVFPINDSFMVYYAIFVFSVLLTQYLLLFSTIQSNRCEAYFFDMIMSCLYCTLLVVCVLFVTHYMPIISHCKLSHKSIEIFNTVFSYCS